MVALTDKVPDQDRGSGHISKYTKLEEAMRHSRESVEGANPNL